jgi:hypothetical protein
MTRKEETMNTIRRFARGSIAAAALLAVPALALASFGGSALQALGLYLPERDETAATEMRTALADAAPTAVELPDFDETASLTPLTRRVLSNALLRRAELVDRIGTVFDREQTYRRGSVSRNLMRQRRLLLLAQLRSLDSIRASIIRGGLTGNAAVNRLILFNTRSLVANREFQEFQSETLQGRASSSTFEFSSTF